MMTQPTSPGSRHGAAISLIRGAQQTSTQACGHPRGLQRVLSQSTHFELQQAPPSADATPHAHECARGAWLAAHVSRVAGCSPGREASACRARRMPSSGALGGRRGGDDGCIGGLGGSGERGGGDGGVGVD